MNSDSLLFSKFTISDSFSSRLINGLDRCEERRRGHRAHLLLRNLKEFDIDYLEGLFENNAEKIRFHEAEALRRGYGPLVPCSYFTSARDRKILCRMYFKQYMMFY